MALEHPSGAPFLAGNGGWWRRAGDGWIAAATGNEARIVIPAGERPIAVTTDFVVSVERLEDGSTVRLRDAATGVVALERSLEMVVADAVIHEDRVFVSGRTVSLAEDPGILALAIGGGPDVVVVPSGPPPERLQGDYVGRTLLSTSGSTHIVASLCALNAGCLTFLIDPDEGTAALSPIPLLSMYPAYSTPRAIVFKDGEAPTSLVAYDPVSGSRLWVHDGQEYQAGYATTKGALVVQSLRPTDSGIVFELEEIDPISGARRTVYSRPATENFALWREVSTDTHAVIGPGPSLLDAPATDGQLVGDIVDLATGALVQGGFRLRVAPRG